MAKRSENPSINNVAKKTKYSKFNNENVTHKMELVHVVDPYTTIKNMRKQFREYIQTLPENTPFESDILMELFQYHEKSPAKIEDCAKFKRLGVDLLMIRENESKPYDDISWYNTIPLFKRAYKKNAGA